MLAWAANNAGAITTFVSIRPSFSARLNEAKAVNAAVSKQSMPIKRLEELGG